ncbi:acyl-CoA synthetase (AMP-forming)/AMP-acid ligase II [Catenulispora sp. MAP12-49]
MPVLQQQDIAVDQSLMKLLTYRAKSRPYERAFTFVDFPGSDATGSHRTLTWSQLEARVQAIAVQLVQWAKPDDRVALALPQGLDYVAAFLGCLRAGVVAVPLLPLDAAGHADRVARVLEDCEPACALVPFDRAQELRTFQGASGAREIPLVPVASGHVTPDTPSERPAAISRDCPSSSFEPELDEIAYLQYTSGSTRSPAGVMISHRNMVVNALQALASLGTPLPQLTAVSWLPLFHDMGLMLGIVAPIVGGFPAVLMDPVAFLEKPERWLRLLGQYPGTVSAAPNFAYDYCVAKLDHARIGELRLDRVKMLVNGSEPVSSTSLQRFQQTFAQAGLRSEAQRPSYGLAEATVFVTTRVETAAPLYVACRRDRLAEGYIEPVPPETEQTASDAVTMLVSCGVPVGQELRIIDPRTRAVLPDDTVGEIAVRGPNVARGYWKRAEETAEVFEAVVPGTGEQPWLRTGDLGAVHDGRLLVTGRLKDLLIVDGRNHYPQDIEETVRAALDAAPNERIAVFSVPGEEGGEQVIAVAERRRAQIPQGAERAALDSVARGRVATVHGLRLEGLVLVSPATIPRTSSGKVARVQCRAAFLQGQYAEHGESGTPDGAAHELTAALESGEQSVQRNG